MSVFVGFGLTGRLQASERLKIPTKKPICSILRKD